MVQPRLIADRYEVLAEIGRGGMGMVARAFDHRLQTEVAIKILRRDLTAGTEETDSLIKEGRILARLSHPSVVRLFDLAETEFGLMLVLEYVRGPNLAQVLTARSKLTETELIFIMRQICAGLDAAHAEGIVHRDLKPPNLLVAADPEAWESFKQGVCTSSFLLNAKVKITDFGISKLLATRTDVTARTAALDHTWSSAGTPLFMSPEQFEGQASTPATDIYALGVVAYRALAGALPFDGDSVEALAAQHLRADPKPIEGCSARVNKAILRAMAKVPSERFSSAGAFLAALEGTGEAAAELPSFEPDPLERVENWSQSHEVAIAIACAVVITLVAAGIWFLASGRSSSGSAPSSNVAVTEAAQPNFGKRLSLPEDMDMVPQITNLPARSPRQAYPAVRPGPKQPRIAWTALIDTEYELDPWVDGVGPDGTVYVREDQLNTLWAIRDGALRWAYRAQGRSSSPLDALIYERSHADFRDPGRMWLAWCPDGRTRNGICTASVFNAAGEGGHTDRVPAGFGEEAIAQETTMPFREVDGQNWRWPESDGQILCSSRLNAVTLSDREKRWTTPLDGHATLAARRSDGLIVSTAHGAIYALDKGGQVQWTYKVDGEPSNLQIMPSGDLVVLEKDRKTFTCIREGKLRWKYESPDLVNEFKDHLTGSSRLGVADTASTLYFIVQQGSDTKTLAVDRAGKLLWKLAWGDYVQYAGLSLDSLGRLFFTFQIYQIEHRSRGGVVCISG